MAKMISAQIVGRRLRAVLCLLHASGPRCLVKQYFCFLYRLSSFIHHSAGDGTFWSDGEKQMAGIQPFAHNDAGKETIMGIECLAYVTVTFCRQRIFAGL